MANIIPVGAGAAVSADIVVAAGTPVAIHGYGADGVNWSVQIQIKNADASYTTVSAVTNLAPLKVIDGPATYRASRPAGGGACAVDNG